MSPYQWLCADSQLSLWKQTNSVGNIDSQVAENNLLAGKKKFLVIYYRDIIKGTIKRVYHIFTLHYAQKNLPVINFIQYVIFQKIILQTDIENRISFSFVYYFQCIDKWKTHNFYLSCRYRIF